MFMCGKSKKSFHEIENLLEEIEKKLPGEESGDSRYTRSLLKVYTRIDSEKARTKSLELGKILLEKNKEYEKEIHEQFAVIYMKDQDYEKAIEECENVLKYGESVVTYKMLIELYETTGQEEKALEAAEKALEKMPESQEISIAYIRILCRSKTVEKEVLEKCIKECVEKNPELLDDSKFKKLQIEYGIQVEGENIWVEK